jgi:hypothetical protein
MHVFTFKTDEELRAFAEENLKAANRLIQPWHHELKPGDCILRFATFWNTVITIYGELLDPIELDRPHYNLEKQEDQKEFAAVQGKYAPNGPWYRSFRFGRFYSPLCSEGELDSIHLSDVACVIPREVFEVKRQERWPQAQPARFGR